MPFFLMFPSKRILILCSAISLPLIYGKGPNDFGSQLKRHLLDPVYPTDTKVKDLQKKFLRAISLMQLYACAPRKDNEQLESVLDCSKLFKNPKSLKEDFEAIWKLGGKRSANLIARIKIVGEKCC